MTLFRLLSPTDAHDVECSVRIFKAPGQRIKPPMRNNVNATRDTAVQAQRVLGRVRGIDVPPQVPPLFIFHQRVNHSSYIQV